MQQNCIENKIIYFLFCGTHCEAIWDSRQVQPQEVGSDASTIKTKKFIFFCKILIIGILITPPSQEKKKLIPGALYELVT